MCCEEKVDGAGVFVFPWRRGRSTQLRGVFLNEMYYTFLLTDHPLAKAHTRPQPHAQKAKNARLKGV